MSKKHSLKVRLEAQRELERKLQLLSAHKKNLARATRLIRMTSSK